MAEAVTHDVQKNYGHRKQQECAGDGSVEKDRPVSAGNEQALAHFVFQKRSQEEGNDHGRQADSQLGQYIAQHAKDEHKPYIEQAAVVHVRADEAEHGNNAEEHRLGNGDQFSCTADKGSADNERVEIADEQNDEQGVEQRCIAFHELGTGNEPLDHEAAENERRSKVSGNAEGNQGHEVGAVHGIVAGFGGAMPSRAPLPNISGCLDFFLL